MKVTGLEFNDGVLRVTCSGEHGVGSEGHPSAILVKSSIDQWIENHPGQSVSQIEVDYTEVDYVWGDGPVSSLMGFHQQGVSRFRLIAGPNNLESLRGLVKGCNIPYFEVEHEPNISFHGTPTRALRGSGPVNSSR
jgi:hypothetical protein